MAIAPGSGVFSIAISPDGKTVAFAGPGKVPLVFFDLPSEKWSEPKPKSDDTIACVAFAQDGKTFATSTAGTRVHLGDPARIWDAASKTVLHKLKPQSMISVHLAYSPENTTLATTEANKSVCLWDVSTGQLITTLPQRGKNAWRVAFSPDGKTLATGSRWDGLVALYDLAGATLLENAKTHRPQLLIDGPETNLCFLAFTHDSQCVITLSDKKPVIQLWDAQTGKMRKEIDRGKCWPARGAALSADGRMLAIACDGVHSELWDLDSGQRVALLGPFFVRAECLAFSPDGSLLVAGACNGDAYFFKLPKKE